MWQNRYLPVWSTHNGVCLVGGENLHSTQNEVTAGLKKELDDLITHLLTQSMHKSNCRLTVVACFSFFTSPFFQRCEEVFATFGCLHHMLIDNPGVSWFNHVPYNTKQRTGLELTPVFSPTAFLL